MYLKANIVPDCSPRRVSLLKPCSVRLTASAVTHAPKTAPCVELHSRGEIGKQGSLPERFLESGDLGVLKKLRTQGQTHPDVGITRPGFRHWINAFACPGLRERRAARDEKGFRIFGFNVLRHVSDQMEKTARFSTSIDWGKPKKSIFPRVFRRGILAAVFYKGGWIRPEIAPSSQATGAALPSRECVEA